MKVRIIILDLIKKCRCLVIIALFYKMLLSTASERKKASEGTGCPIEPLILNFNGIPLLYNLSHLFRALKPLQSHDP